MTLRALGGTLHRAGRAGLGSRASGLRATISGDLNSKTRSSRARPSASLKAVGARGRGESRIRNGRGRTGTSLGWAGLAGGFLWRRSCP